MSENQVVLFLGVIVAFFGICYLCFQCWASRIVKDSFAEEDVDHCERVVEFARIVDKIPGQSVMGVATPCQLMFEDEKGERKTFSIKDGTIYAQALIGDEGQLTYAGRAFVKFERKRCML